MVVRSEACGANSAHTRMTCAEEIAFQSDVAWKPCCSRRPEHVLELSVRGGTPFPLLLWGIHRLK